MPELPAGLELWQIAAAAAVVYGGWVLVKRLLASDDTAQHKLRGTCSCGWSGVVSRYKRTCPKCGGEVAIT